MSYSFNVLVACEYSNVVRDAFADKGCFAVSCDYEKPYNPYGFHFQGDVKRLLVPEYHWDLMIAHPPCTYLCSSGLHWNGRVPGRADETEKALEFVNFLLSVNIKHIALENPKGCISTRIRKADQYIQPYDFGHDASKSTGLWLKNLPLLTQTSRVHPRLTEDGKMRWSNQTDSGQNILGPSVDRWKLRSETYKGIAEAMADQWFDYILLNK